MLTPSFSLTATERILPRFELDFTTANLDARVTFARSLDTATRVNASGFIETVNANTPRFDFSPVTLVCRGLLIEESRQNILTYSNGFADDTVWSYSNISVSSVTNTNPDGASTSLKIIENTAASVSHSIFKNVAFVSGQAYTFSIYAKKAGRKYVRLRGANSTTFPALGIFNLDTGVVTSISGGTATITDAGNGWYRISVTGTAGANAATAIQVQLYDDSLTLIYTGDGTSGVYLYGGQVELGSFATSYIPTEASSVTRNADVVTMTGTNFSDWWTATTGAVTVRYTSRTVSGTRPIIEFDDNTADNFIVLRGNTTNPELYIKATTDQVQIDAGTIAANTNYGLSGAWNTDDCAAAINGAAAVTDTSATIPTVTQSRLGSDGTNYLNGWLQSVQYWPQRITNAEVQAFSKL